jgi:hypothetical protein
MMDGNKPQRHCAKLPDNDHDLHSLVERIYITSG